ncbi:hypothetical protein WBG78_28510 [Chryseolinea sp. T2]|uniref:hypothetical protein n=1 Tax=Chryseolinea sp. T2 TaxID=3129255 RepID=UPI00307718E7
MTREEIDKLREADPATLTPKQRSLLQLTHVEKGQVLNPEGRKVGVPNRVNKDSKELLKLALENNMPKVDAAISQLLESNNEATRLRAIEVLTRLLEFTTPRLAAVAVKTDGEGNRIIVIGKPQELGMTSQDSNAIHDEETNNNTIDVTPDE